MMEGDLKSFDVGGDDVEDIGTEEEDEESSSNGDENKKAGKYGK